MKKILVFICMLLTFIMIQLPVSPKVLAAPSSNTVTILFTHDLHDNELPFSMAENGNNVQVGGYARLKSAIDAQKQIDPNALLLDAGDYSMGSLFQTIYSTDSPELRLLGQMGYDVTTFGNHEFDFKADGLAQSLNSAKSSGDKLPQIVESNLSFPTDKSGSLSTQLSGLKKAMDNYGVKDYTILKRNGLKIGVFGLMGKDAASDSPLAGVTFTDQVQNAKRVVTELKKQKADLIICLSHSGIDSDTSKSEDEILAKEVPDINVIISGHTHTLLKKPIVVKNTIIGSCGCYGQYLGAIKIEKNSSGIWKLNGYNLEQIDNSFSDDAGITNSIQKYESLVQEKYLNHFGLTFNQVLAYSPYNFTNISQLESRHAEDTLGDLISDSYMYAVKQAEGSDYQPVAAAVVPAGTIRGSFFKGNITVANAFAASSLGIGEDNISGYPLISVYLTGKELKAVCEVDASITPLMPDAQLYFSGLDFTYNPNRLIFDKVTGVHLIGENSSTSQLQDSKLYRVVAGLYSGEMLSKVSGKSFGLLSIVPKNASGAPITDFNAQIIKTSNNLEIKEWQAIAEYLQSFPKANGVSQVPQYYGMTHERKVADDTHNPVAIIKNPNTFAMTVYIIILALVALIVIIIVLIATRKKRKEKRKLKRKLKTKQ